MGYFGVVQSENGADHVFLFTEDTIKKEFKNYGIDMCFLPKYKEDPTDANIGWPIGGSDASTTRIEKIETKEEASDFLSQKAYGPASNDPTLSELADYDWTIEIDFGCAVDILKESALPKEMWEGESLADINQLIEDICNGLWIEEKKFHDDEYKDMTCSDALLLGNLREAFLETKELPDFKTTKEGTELMLQIPEKGSKHLVIKSNIPDNEKDAPHDIYLRLVSESPSLDSFDYAFTEKNPGGWKRDIYINLDSNSAQSILNQLICDKVGWMSRKRKEMEKQDMEHSTELKDWTKD